MPRRSGKHRREQGARSLLRYDFLAATHGPAVAARLRESKDSHWQGGNDAELFRRFAEKVDPSGADKDKPWRYLKWACIRYLETPVLPEDLYKIGEDLILFEDRKKRGLLKDGKADIQRYSIPALVAFAAAVQGGNLDGFDDMLAKAPASVMDATTILYRGSEGIALVPHSREAAIHWSRGTRWCTGAENGNNRFFSYNINGPLVILFTAAGKERYQVHVSSVIMDAQDKEATATPELCALLDRIDIRFLKKTPSSWNTSPDWRKRDYVLMQVQQDGGMLVYATPKLKADREVVLKAVQEFGLALQYAAPELRADPEIVLEAVRQDGLALCHAVPELRANRNIVCEAVRQNRDALEDASLKLQLSPFFRYRIRNILPRFTGIALRDWATRDSAVRQRIFEEEIRMSWKAIAFAADCGVTPDFETQRKIFARARTESPEQLANALHIFPALRGEWKKRALGLDEAAAILGTAPAAAPGQARPSPG